MAEQKATEAKAQTEAKAERLTASEPVKVEQKAGHKRPESLKPIGKGRFGVRGTDLEIVQGADGKWTVHGHTADLGAFRTRGAALAKLESLGMVPPVPPAAPARAKPDRPTEQKEEGVNQRRTGSTGTPKRTRPAGESIHVKGSRAQKVG